MERKRETVVKIVHTNARELGQVEDVKYLGSVMEAEGGSWKAVKQRVKVAWMKWRDMSGVRCDKRMPRKVKRKTYRAVIRLVLLHGTKCWTIRKKEENLMRTEMRMLRWILGVSLKDKIRNEEIRRRCGVVSIAEKVKEARLRWYGRVMRGSNEEPIRSITELKIERRPKKRWLDHSNPNNTVSHARHVIAFYYYNNILRLATLSRYKPTYGLLLVTIGC